MTRSNLLFSHAAVFAVGISAAMVANSVRNASAADAGTATTPSERRAAGATDGTGPGADARRGTDREGRAGARDRDSATDRLAAIARNPDPFERQRQLMALIDKLGPGEFAEVADRFRELDHLGDSRGEYALLLRGWAKLDPLAALAYVGEQGGQGRGTVLETWGGVDALAAERWAMDNHDGEGANPYLASVISGIAAHDIDHAALLTQTMPSSRERGQAIEAVTRALMAQGIDAAMAFPASIRDEHLRGSFASSIANRLAGRDPAAAATWLAALDEGGVQNRAARSVGTALARNDPQQAAAWVAKLSPEARAEAARGVIPAMSSGDIAGTARWVSTLAGTPGYDRVVEEFIWSCNDRAPEQSAAWIQGVADPDRQRQIYQRILTEWGRKDQQAMQQWVMANNVPDDIRRRFLR